MFAAAFYLPPSTHFLEPVAGIISITHLALRNPSFNTLDSGLQMGPESS